MARTNLASEERVTVASSVGRLDRITVDSPQQCREAVVTTCSRRRGLEDTESRGRRRCACVAELRGSEQSRVLLRAALASAGVDEHVQVGQLRVRTLVRRAEVALDPED